MLKVDPFWVVCGITEVQSSQCRLMAVLSSAFLLFNRLLCTPIQAQMHPFSRYRSGQQRRWPGGPRAGQVQTWVPARSAGPNDAGGPGLWDDHRRVRLRRRPCS
jgi:hypothetical protein